MKRIFQLAALLCLLSAFPSCEKSGFTDNADAGMVRFTVGGSASPLSRAAGGKIASADKEKDIESIHAVLFNYDDGTFYNAVKTTLSGDVTAGFTCSFYVADNGRFKVYFVANAEEDLVNQFDNTQLTVDTFGDLLAAQVPDPGNKFLMLSRNQNGHWVDLTTSIDNGTDLGTVSLERLAVRIDITNNIDDVTVTKVVYKNRAVKTNLVKGNSMPADNPYDEKAYDNLSVAGSSTVPGELKETIYSYENHNTDAATLPVLEITYEDKDGTPGTHTVHFYDTEAADPGTPLALKRNHLYRVTLIQKSEITFNLEVLDWDEEIMLDTPDAGITDAELEKTKALKVWQIFSTARMAKTLEPSGEDVEVVFHDNSIFSSSALVASAAKDKDTYFTYCYLSDGQDNREDSAQDKYTPETHLGLIKGSTALTDGDCLSLGEQLKKIYEKGDAAKAKSYRIPSVNDLKLLLPDVFTDADNNGRTFDFFPYWSGNSTLSEATQTAWTEGHTEFFEYEDDYFGGSQTIGKSWLKHAGEGSRVVFGLRFSGTDQFSAYRWEVVNQTVDVATAGGKRADNAYLSVRVKAVDAGTTIDAVADENFWSTGSVEIRVPALGYLYYSKPFGMTGAADADGDGKYNDATLDGVLYRGQGGYCWSLSPSPTSVVSARSLGFDATSASVGDYGRSDGFPVLLVESE